jgi:uncharacterized membrane protein YphA (DoxX/SURF4 family)
LDGAAGFRSAHGCHALRRLFSTFASGAPGAGLLLLRLACATILLSHAITALLRAQGLSGAALQVPSAALGVLLVAGLWTPIAAMLAAVDALLVGFSIPAGYQFGLLPAAVAAALALLGPGAWSLDAKLFGWKRVEIDGSVST